ncbi:FecR domain-containing protein [Desulfomarina sp.]
MVKYYMFMKNQTGTLFFFLLLLSFFSVSPCFSDTLIPIIVKDGSNLTHIARDYCNSRDDWRIIARLNRIKPPYTVYPGQTLQIPLSLLLAEKLFAKVDSVSGGVFILQNGRTLIPLKKGDHVKPGQTVVTEDDGFAFLIFPDNRFTRLAGGTRFSMTYLVRLTDNSMKAEFFLEKGRIVHSVKSRLKRNETFLTKTPVSVTGVRGTEFRMKVPGGNSNIIETIQGVVGVHASGKTIAVEKGKGLKVVAGKLPEQPRDLPPSPPLPELEPVYKTLPVVLTVPGMETATSLRLRVATDLEGMHTVLEQFVKAGEQFTLLALEDRTYYGYLTQIDERHFESLPAGPFEIRVRTVPSAPIISDSLEGKTLFKKKISHKWLRGSGAGQFFVQLASDREFKTIIEEKIQEENEYTTPELTQGEYFFRLQAIADDGFHSNYSRVDSWKIADQPSLDNFEPVTGKNVILRWKSMGEGIVYDFQVAEDRQFHKLVVEKSGLEDPVFQFTDYLEPASYYVRVRGVLSDGQISPWTPYQVLTIEQEPFGILDAGVALFFLTCLVIIL